MKKAGDILKETDGPVQRALDLGLVPKVSEKAVALSSEQLLEARMIQVARFLPPFRRPHIGRVERSAAA
jgi:hypothetical protein